MSRRTVAVAVLQGPLLTLEVAPGFAVSLEEVDALAGALLGARREPAEDETAAEGAA